MLYYRFHGFPVAADAPLGTTIARVNECLSKAGVANTPLRFCFSGERACSAIAAKFPELGYFLTDQGSPQDEAPRQHLSNFGLSAPGALAGPAGEVPFETIAAVVEGIPTEFPIYLVTVALGPIVQGRTFVPTPSARSPLLVLLNSQCVSIHWQDSPTRQGEKYSLSVIEPLPTADPNQPLPDWIRALYSGFPGAAAEKISSEIDWIAMDYGTVVRSEGSPSVKSKSIPDDLNLPYKLPDAKAASELKHAALKGVRDIVARVFVDDGWKQRTPIESNFQDPKPSPVVAQHTRYIAVRLRRRREECGGSRRAKRATRVRGSESTLATPSPRQYASRCEASGEHLGDGTRRSAGPTVARFQT